MDTNIDNLKRFLDQVRSVGFWGRLFGWRRIKDQLTDAIADLERFLANYGHEQARTAVASHNANMVLKTEQEKSTNLLHEIAILKSELRHTQEEGQRAQDKVMLFEADKEMRAQEHREEMATLKQYQDRIQNERDQEIRERHAAEVKRLENLKNTWVHHQERVRETMRVLCRRHTIDYVQKVAFKGDPDNTVRICGEFIVFDAKSPRGDDLSNFRSYIKEQAEKARKYANLENVKTWIFFVVPVNTLEVLDAFVYHLADYHVFVVTVDALEPVLLSLKKVEEYEMAEKLSPENRENICRILGKFAHLSKRRIQVDTFFINQFMELAYKCENDLPSDVLEKSIEFERAEKLNPPQEKRTKAIPIADLEKSLTKIQNDAGNKGISLEPIGLTEGLNGVPLYSSEAIPINLA